MIDRNIILKLIKENKLKKVFEDLLENIKDEFHRNSIILITSRYNELENNLITGIISFTEYTILRNQIVQSLLLLVNEIDFTFSVHDNKKTDKKDVNNVGMNVKSVNLPTFKLSGKEKDAFADVLISAFLTEKELNKLVEITFDKPLNQIVSPGNMQHQAFELIGWAIARGKLEQLMRGAVENNSGNKVLSDFVGVYISIDDPNSHISIKIDKTTEPEDEKTYEDYTKQVWKLQIDDAKKELQKVENEISELKKTKAQKKKILYITSAPENLSQIRFQEEIKTISNAYKTSGYAKKIYLVPKLETAVLARHLKKLIKEEPNPQILHISLHGRKDEGLVFSDENGKENTIDDDTFAAWFKNLKNENVHIKCVLINACHSSEICEAIAPFVDYAIGMKNKILDKSATCFTEGFYNQLFINSDIELAFIEGVDYIRGGPKCDNEGITQMEIPMIFNNGKQLKL